MPEFVVLMTETGDAWSSLPPAAQERLLKKYGAWVGALRKKRAFVRGEAVGGGGRVLKMAGSRISEKPFHETRNVLTGYFVVRAKDLGAAAKLARGCPALGHGETVTVRPLG